MALFRNIERRHLEAGSGRTTIALERDFWRAADNRAAAEGVSWREWTQKRLTAMPAGSGRASWLRVAILNDIAAARGLPYDG